MVEFTDGIGSYAGRLLAGLGAEVIKVELPAGGARAEFAAVLRTLRGRPGPSIAFWVHNTSKKPVVMCLAEDVVAVLQAHGVPAGIVQTAQDLLERDPHMRVRGYYRYLDSPEAGRTAFDGPVARLRETPGGPFRTCADAGRAHHGCPPAHHRPHAGRDRGPDGRRGADL